MYIIILNIIHHRHLYFSSKIDSVFYLLRILRPFIFFIPTKKRIIFPPEIFIVFMLKRIAPEITFHSSSELQAPRFITLPSASGSVVAEGRTKILQCQALGEFRFLFAFSLCFLSAFDIFRSILPFSKQCYGIHILIMIMSEACNELSDPSYFPDCQLCICRRNIVMCTD